MLIIPAIDLQAGRCVRLQQGQFDKQTEFAIDPVDRAHYFASLGAIKLHVVDLDGAKNGAVQQLPLITAMSACGIPIQAGGGIRSLDQAQQCLQAGISQVVIGSMAISNPAATLALIQELGASQIVLALDVRLCDGMPMAATHGWQQNSSQSLWDIINDYEKAGIQDVLCTDIACDGMMAGPNFDLYQQAVSRFPNIAWQASGGIRDSEDIARLNAIGVQAAILGLTLYQGNFNLSECLKEYALC